MLYNKTAICWQDFSGGRKTWPRQTKVEDMQLRASVSPEHDDDDDDDDDDDALTGFFSFYHATLC